ncbi:MAG: putative metal-binding motif-containing protein [Deltaproteobacteria bacterium]|nr:putative metal-binding motif-containing protein [Deltaproteobacteria bacterium]
MVRLALLLFLTALLGTGCLAWSPDGTDGGADDDDDIVDDDDDATDPPVDADGDGVSVADGDCDDTNPGVFPGAEELCNEVDDDCDGDVDDGVPLDAFRPDADGDDFPSLNAGLEVLACSAPDGYLPAIEPFDCADSLPGVYPGAEETCNGIDDDCDGAADNGVLVSLYVDQDLDGSGAGTSVGLGCPGEGFSANSEDCDDDDAALNSNDLDGDGVSSCDGDCQDDDASVVPGVDSDGDGELACFQDCDDTDASIGTNATEVCNQSDDNCDGVPDDGLSPALVIRGTAPGPGNKVWEVLDSSGYCAAPPMEAVTVTPDTAVWFYEIIIVTAGTGDASGWLGDTTALDDWYWSTAPAGASSRALVGMGMGGLALFEALGVDPDFTPGGSGVFSGGTTTAESATDSVWSWPNQVLGFGGAVTVHTQSFATHLGLLNTQAHRVLGTNPAGSGVLVVTPPWSGGQTPTYFWGFEQGLQLASTPGLQLFENLLYDAIGPP